MSVIAYPTLFANLHDSDYRQAFLAASVRQYIALQNRVLRKKMQWTQAQLGEAAGKPQNVISRLENPNYGKVNLQTLLDMANAFNVALIVRFGTFGELAEQMEDLSDSALFVSSFSQELSNANSRRCRHRRSEDGD